MFRIRYLLMIVFFCLVPLHHTHKSASLIFLLIHTYIHTLANLDQMIIGVLSINRWGRH